MKCRELWIRLLLLIVSSVTAATASPINPGSWYEFGFDPNHYLLAAGCQPADPDGVPCRTGIGAVFLGSEPWTFTTPVPVRFTITDGLLSGDYFDVLDFGVLVGSTPPVPLTTNCGLDPNVCLVTAGMSNASFVLGAGTYSITIKPYAAQILGEGFFRVDPVPEPSTFGYLILALTGICTLRRARRV